jgi:hypothetical protein
MKAKTIISVIAAISLAATSGAVPKNYNLKSPDGKISVEVTVGENISYSVDKGVKLIDKSNISMSIAGGEVFGKNNKVRKVTRKSVNHEIVPVVYKKAKVIDNYNEITLSFKKFDLVFRAYDDGVAYRFVSMLGGSYNVESEQAEFHFAKDWPVYVPYVRKNTQTLETQYFNSFENIYAKHRLSEWNKERIAFLPLTVEAENGIKICIAESDFIDYPGMFLYNGDGSSVLTARFAPYPKEVVQGGHNMLQGIIKSRENYIAAAEGRTEFPWRAIIIAGEDKDLLNSDMVWKLASAPKDNMDFSWVRPGKVAWEWWNDWNLRGVDFKTGINNDTYKYYIDFAAAHGIEYVILDEGWAVNKKADLFRVVPEIDLPTLVQYASGKGVGLILWAGYWAINRDIEKVCRHYSEMGVKGFKVDFMDRDDQQMVRFYTDLARTAAKYHLMLDFHGAYKPSGLQRTWPNVVNFEGVHGLEQMKWSDLDQVTYDVTIPFIRMVAGPMDYTQGAMRNATKENFRAVYSEAMSQGTRCRQLAEYVIFESPLNMLCDSPSNYMHEPECTKFIAECPVTWDETVAIDGKISEYVVMARRKGDKWYVGAMTDWSPRDLKLDLSFLGEGKLNAEIFQDGVNADKAACDFSHVEMKIDTKEPIDVHLAPGGGWAAIFSR